MSNVYVVDDDKTTHTVLKSILENAGHSVKCYLNAADFIANYSGDDGVLILDHYMDEMNGLELQELMVAENHPLAIIFLSTSDDLTVAKEALTSGAVDYLEKPVNSADILTSVAKALNPPKSKRHPLILWSMGMVTVGVTWFVTRDDISDNQMAVVAAVMAVIGAYLKLRK